MESISNLNITNSGVKIIHAPKPITKDLFLKKFPFHL